MRVAILGCGNMGRAIVAGLSAKHVRGLSVACFDKSAATLKHLPRGSVVRNVSKWFRTRARPDVVVIAVKPQDIAGALKDLAKASKGPGSTLWLSIAAGVSIARIESHLGAGARVCRAMPNTPALIGEAASAYALGSACGPMDVKRAEFVLGAIGVVSRVPEKMMDAITGLSGSGPAYVYLFIEALVEAGITAGLPRDVAEQFAVQTVAGAARMVKQSDESPAELKSRVMSPGGTTARGLMQLEKHGFKYSVIQAVTAATHRSAELGA